MDKNFTFAKIAKNILRQEFFEFLKNAIKIIYFNILINNFEN